MCDVQNDAKKDFDSRALQSGSTFRFQSHFVFGQLNLKGHPVCARQRVHVQENTVHIVAMHEELQSVSQIWAS